MSRGMDTVAKQRSKRKQKIRHGLSRMDEAVLKDRLLRTTCSEPWVRAQFNTIRDTGPDGQDIVTRWFDPTVYPPKADTTPMIVCVQCGVPTPPPAVGSSGVCLDCHCGNVPWQQDAWGASYSAVVIQKIEMMNTARERVVLSRRQ